MDNDIVHLLKTAHTVAVVGLSPNRFRPAYTVASYLQDQGYRVIPVNPGAGEVLGEKGYPSLTSIPDPIDIVDIFRRSEFVPDIVDEAIMIGARAVWMQLGIVNEVAAEKARRAGLVVVMDRCLHIEHARLKMAGLL